jgi:hypothetical protein
LNANIYFFLETPTLGEVDWRWTSTGTTYPHSGYFQVNILDVSKVSAAYGSHGIGGDGQGPSDGWFPGADLASANVGRIEILDYVLVTSNYGKKFGIPP